MNILESLSSIVGGAFSQAGYDAGLGLVVESEAGAQFQCNGALAGARSYGVAPRVIAEKVAAVLAENPDIRLAEAAGPGFINISVTDAFLGHVMAQTAADPRLGVSPAPSPDKLFLDFGGPNVAKPMHVGHLRSAIIGDSLQRLYRFMGNDVVSDIHLGDWGTQMGMVICGVRRDMPGLPYFKEDYAGPYPAESPVTLADFELIYPRESALCKTDENAKKEALQATAELQAGRPGYRALWQHFVDISVAGLKENFGWFGVSFDEWNGESRYNDQIPALLERLKADGVAQESDGALVIFVDDSIPPLILVKSDGAYLYGTTDVATIAERVSQGATRIVYVVDKRQDLHFRQLFGSVRKAALAPESVRLEFLGFGTMNGTDGKPFKTRAGGVMKLSDLIVLVTEKAREKMGEAGVATDYPEAEREDIAKAVGKAALKFADLINNRASDYIFDLDRFMSFEGKTGPYIIYTAVRIKSVFRRVGESGGVFAPELSGREREMLLVASVLPQAVQAAYEMGTPNALCEFAFRLCQAFNRFYQECNILHETDPARKSSWLASCDVVLRELELVSGLLGLDIPERM